MTEIKRSDLPRQSPADERAAIARLAESSGETLVTYTFAELHALITECENMAADDIMGMWPITLRE